MWAVGGGQPFLLQESLVPADLKIQAGPTAPVQQAGGKDTWLPWASRVRRDEACDVGGEVGMVRQCLLLQVRGQGPSHRLDMQGILPALSS